MTSPLMAAPAHLAEEEITAWRETRLLFPLAVEVPAGDYRQAEDLSAPEDGGRTLQRGTLTEREGLLPGARHESPLVAASVTSEEKEVAEFRPPWTTMAVSPSISTA